MNTGPVVQDFCVLWDEDHDQRVIPVIERIYMASLLSPVLFIGERKGGLTVLVRESFFEDTDVDAFERYSRALCAISEDSADSWGCSIGTFSPSGPPLLDVRGYLVNDKADRVNAYLAGIDASWSLGIKPFVSRVDHQF